jgi:hypothetical protein
LGSSSHASTLYAEFSMDSTQTDRTIPLSSGNDGGLGLHCLIPITKYFRVKIVNGNTNQVALRLQTIYHPNPNIALPTSRIQQTLNEYTDVLNVRSALFGETDGNKFVSVPVTSEGHLETAIHSPILPFGSVHTENIIPVFQTDAVYSLNPLQIESGSTFSGTTSVLDSKFVCTTGTTIYSQAYIQSRKRLRYRPGQGIVGRFAGFFSHGVTNSYQLAGFGHSEDGVYFGYSGSSFGIFYTSHGKREIQKLNITTPSTTAENVTVVLNGFSSSVAVTNNNNIYRTAYELSLGRYSGWKVYPESSSVVFVSDAVGNKAGSFSFIASTAVGNFSEILAGTSSTELFISQSDWNGDKMDGNGNSGIRLNPQRGNVYQMGIQYLGFGAITFQIESAFEGNNPDWISVHTLEIPNQRELPSFGNPSFPFTMAVYSAGSTSNLSASISSFAGFIEGKIKLHGNRYSYSNTISTAGPTNYQALFTIYNRRSFKGRSNQSVINILDVSVALKHNQPGSFFLIRNGTLSGNVDFEQYDDFSNSMIDTSATTVSITSQQMIVWVGNLAETSNIYKNFDLDSEEITLQPGEWITLACRTSGGTATYAAGSINTREDQ